MHYGGGSDRSTWVADIGSRGVGRLRFPAELEAQFMVEGAAQRLKLVRWGAFGSVAVFAGFLIVDRIMIPDRLGMAAWLRVVIYPLVVLGGLYLAGRMGRPRVTEWLAAGAGVLAGAISMALSSWSHSPYAVHHLVVLNVVVVYATLIGRFWPMLTMCVLIALGHVAALLAAGHLWSNLGMATTLLLVSTMVFTLYGNYVLEHSDRQAYLLDKQEGEMNAQLARANESLAMVVRTDPLTGLPNRRHFDDFLSQVWAQAMLHRTTVALLLIDIDHFKPYNDIHGHQAGDRCLCTVAQALSGCLRKSGDLVSRWGGEEFAVVMSGASPQMAHAAAQRLLDSVRSCELPHAGSQVSPVVTASIGLAVMVPGPGVTLDDLLLQADRALYRAKAAGRDQVNVGDGCDQPGLMVAQG